MQCLWGQLGRVGSGWYSMNWHLLLSLPVTSDLLCLRARQKEVLSGEKGSLC